MLIKQLKSIFNGAEKGRRYVEVGLDKRPTKGYVGFVDIVDATEGIRGWVLDVANPGKAQTVLVMLGTRVIGCSVTKLLRSDVAELLGRQTVCGFQFAWNHASEVPDTVSPEHNELTLLIVGTDLRLSLPPSCPPVDEILQWIPLVCRESYQPRDRIDQQAEDGEGDEEVEAAAAASGDFAAEEGDGEIQAAIAASSQAHKEEQFDIGFYLAMHPNVLEAGLDPETHYHEAGWKEGHDPNPYFSTRYYLETSPDVAEAGINPFEHYQIAGRAEGRLGRQPGGFKTPVLTSIKSLEQIVTRWTRKDEATLLSNSAVRELVREAVKGRINGIVIALSHDDYTKNIGGIQLCLALEQKAFAKRDRCYIHVSPWQPLPILSTRSELNTVLSFSIDGKPIGNCWSRDLLDALTSIPEVAKSESNSMVVHALHGHSVDFVIALHKIVGPRQAYFWLHDYFSMCTGYNLLRNCVSYCSAPTQKSQACAICIYGDSRPDHVESVTRLFAAIDFTVIGPSAFVASLWEEKVSLPHSSLVTHEHCVVVEDGTRVAYPELKLESKKLKLPKPLKIAFIGQPTVHKGWPVFRSLVLRLCSNPAYEFHHLGSDPDASLPVHFRKVRVTPEKPDAMVEAMKEENIDAVVQWSIWPETFCITAHEALAAGAVVITSTTSGNITCLIDKIGFGLIFENEEKLYASFADNQVAKYVAEQKQRGIPYGHLKFSDMTADLVS